AGMHLLDPQTGEYNRPFVEPFADALDLIEGYGRMQCLVFRPDDERFRGKSVEEALHTAVADSSCRMVNRNPGSGTRILIDGLLQDACATAGEDSEPSTAVRPAGYGVQVRSHNAVCAAVKDSRA